MMVDLMLQRGKGKSYLLLLFLFYLMTLSLHQTVVSNDRTSDE
jgi:hypothetical protein